MEKSETLLLGAAAVGAGVFFLPKILELLQKQKKPSGTGGAASGLDFTSPVLTGFTTAVQSALSKFPSAPAFAAPSFSFPSLDFGKIIGESLSKATQPITDQYSLATARLQADTLQKQQQVASLQDIITRVSADLTARQQQLAQISPAGKFFQPVFDFFVPAGNLAQSQLSTSPSSTQLNQVISFDKTYLDSLNLKLKELKASLEVSSIGSALQNAIGTTSQKITGSSAVQATGLNYTPLPAIASASSSRSATAPSSTPVPDLAQQFRNLGYNVISTGANSYIARR